MEVFINLDADDRVHECEKIFHTNAQEPLVKGALTELSIDQILTKEAY